MKRHFSKFGNIVSAYIKCDVVTKLSKGYGFVSYDTTDSATHAVQTMNGLVVSENRRLKVEKKWDKDQDKNDQDKDKEEDTISKNTIDNQKLIDDHNRNILDEAFVVLEKVVETKDHNKDHDKGQDNQCNNDHNNNNGDQNIFKFLSDEYNKDKDIYSTYKLEKLVIPNFTDS